MNLNPSKSSLPYECKVELADGTSYAGTVSTDEDEQILWIRLIGDYMFEDVSPVFRNPRKTGRINSVVYSILDHATYEHTYSGYTDFAYIRQAGDQIHIMLKKPEKK